MRMGTTLFRRLCQVFSGGAVGNVLSIGVLALPAFADAADTSTAQLSQRVEITGDDMKKAGHTNVSQVLQNIIAHAQSSLCNSVSGFFAAGASGIFLRGFSAVGKN